MEPIATSAFVVFLDMSSTDAGSFKQVKENGKVFYDFENFTGRVGTRLFVTEGSQSIEIGRSETADNNAHPGSRKAVPTNRGRSGNREKKKLSAAALSVLDESSSDSNDSGLLEYSDLMDDSEDPGLMEDSDDTEVLTERLTSLRTNKSVRFTDQRREEDEKSESMSEEEEPSKERDSGADESSKEGISDSEKEDPSEEQEGGSEEEDSSNEGKEASEDDGVSVEVEFSNKEGDIERKETSKDVGKEDKASYKQQGNSKHKRDNADGDHGSDNGGIGEDCNKKLPINYSAWKKKELEIECRLRDLASDGKKAILIERLQENDKRMMNDEDESDTEHDEDNGEDEAVPEKRTSHRRNARRH
jgi:hypothetical protein